MFVHSTFIKDYGRTIKPEELAGILDIDRRTVIKYADRWGGIEVSPGKYRFFEKLIRRKIDAKFNYEKRQEEVAGNNNGQWAKKRPTVSRPHKGVETGSGLVGKGGKGKDRKRADRHGLFNKS